jgi:hypothetical protein
VYPPDQVQSALTAVFKYNWAPDVGPYNTAFPPERWFARPGEAGLLVCTWPRGGRPDEPVRYRDEVWTGIEYQVAAGLMWEGLVEPALLILHGIDQRYDGTKHNPWNEVECGDHYARALASWGVLHALAGFTYDGPAGKLAFAPRIQPDSFSCFFCAGTGWGVLSRSRQLEPTPQQTDAMHLQFGTLHLAHLTLEVPAAVGARQVTASITTADDPTCVPVAVPAMLTQKGKRITLRFTPAINLQKGDVLAVTIVGD